MIGVSNLQSVNFCVMEAIKLCRLDTPIIFIEARINLSRFVVTGCAAKTSATVTFPSLNLISLFAFCSPMLCVTIFVILVVWFLLPRVARLMIHTPTAISIFVCLSMVQLMAVFISMRCTLCGHFLQVALTLILVVGYAIAAS